MGASTRRGVAHCDKMNDDISSFFYSSQGIGDEMISALSRTSMMF